MQELDARGLERLESLLSQGGEFVAQVKEELMPGLADRLQAHVDQFISSNLRDTHGKVRSWQEANIGDFYGYAAIRAKAETFHMGYAVGHITNALESGHRIRGRSPNSKSRYRNRVKVPAAKARRFYRDARDNVGSITASFRNEFSQKLTEKITEAMK